MKVRPLGDRVLVRRDPPQEKIGNILLPDSAQEKTLRGTVIAVGTGHRLEDGSLVALELRKEDRVLFTAYAGNEVKGKRKDDELLVIREADILGVIEEE